MLARNGLLTLLSNKIALVREAAAHVFRAFPETYREVTSTHERRRRAAARRAKVKDTAKAKDEAVNGGAAKGG